MYIHRTIHGVGYDPMNDGGVHRIHRQPVISSEDSDFVQNCATNLEAHPSILHRVRYVVKTLPLSQWFTTSMVYDVVVQVGDEAEVSMGRFSTRDRALRFNDAILTEIRTDLGLGDGSTETR